MTFKEAQDQARTLSETHQAVYVAIDDGDRSTWVRFSDYATAIHIYDGRPEPDFDMSLTCIAYDKK